jgi:hypothetical protein
MIPWEGKIGKYFSFGEIDSWSVISKRKYSLCCTEIKLPISKSRSLL